MDKTVKFAALCGKMQQFTLVGQNHESHGEGFSALHKFVLDPGNSHTTVRHVTNRPLPPAVSLQYH